MDMNNPQMAAMAQQMMSDPEVMSLMMRPGVMEKLQRVMADPSQMSALQGDPDMMQLMVKFQSLMGGAGGAGAGLGSYGMGGYGQAAQSSNGGGKENIISIHSQSQFDNEMKKAAAANKLVVADFTTTWCGPCKRIAPVFSELSGSYSDKAVFLKVDGDVNREWILNLNVTGFPTFHFYINGTLMDSFSGADESRLRKNVEEFTAELNKPPPCPYKHFPLRDEELAKFLDIKWELVTPKLKENNTKLTEESSNVALSADEIKVLDEVVNITTDKMKYHSTTYPASTSHILFDKMLKWPAQYILPVLNLVRIMLSHPDAAKTFAAQLEDKKSSSSSSSSSAASFNIVRSLCDQLKAADKSAAVILIARTLSNLFMRRILAKVVVRSLVEEIVESTVAVLSKDFAQEENVKLALVAVWINLTIVLSEEKHSARDEASQESIHGSHVLLLSTVHEQITALVDAAQSSKPWSVKYLYRLLVILGSLLYVDAPLIELSQDLQVQEQLAELKKENVQAQLDAVTKEVLSEVEKVFKK